MTPSLKIAGREISIASWLDLDISIEPIGGQSVRRLANGSAFKMSQWQKHRITLSGSGWVPAELLGIDFEGTFEIELPFPEAFATGDTLPSGWSSRSAPYGEYSYTDQAGNVCRMIYPKMTVVSEGPRKTINSGVTPSWELVCEVV